MIINSMNVISVFFFNKTDILQGTALKHVRPQYPSVKGDGPLIETQKTEAPWYNTTTIRLRWKKESADQFYLQFFIGYISIWIESFFWTNKQFQPFIYITKV